ncbi:MAG: hypothetical protein P4M02_05015, partial [Clostridia bacterium]|nr:hypothetical protein [Clostridia bacterium]
TPYQVKIQNIPVQQVVVTNTTGDITALKGSSTFNATTVPAHVNGTINWSITKGSNLVSPTTGSGGSFKVTAIDNSSLYGEVDAQATCNGVSTTLPINVNQYVNVNSFTAGSDSTISTLKGQVTLTASVNGNASDNMIHWSDDGGTTWDSDNSSVVDVSSNQSNGTLTLVVTAHANNTVGGGGTVNFIFKPDGPTATGVPTSLPVKVTVNNLVYSILLSASTLTINSWQGTSTITTTISPSDATNKTLTYSTSPYYSYSSGVLKATNNYWDYRYPNTLSVPATFFATSSDGTNISSNTLSFTINLIKLITISDNSYNKKTSGTLKHGNHTLTLIPNIASGYTNSFSWSLSPTSVVTGSSSSGNAYLTSPSKSSVTVNAGTNYPQNNVLIYAIDTSIGYVSNTFTLSVTQNG